MSEATVDGITFKGYVFAHSEDSLYLKTEDGEQVKFTVRDTSQRWRMFCHYVKVSIEVMEDNEVVPIEHLTSIHRKDECDEFLCSHLTTACQKCYDDYLQWKSVQNEK